VALTPQTLIGAGVSGALTAGLPGAGAAVLATVLASFGREKSPDTFAGTPKEPLELPFWDVMRQFQGVIAQKWMENQAAGGAITDVIRKAGPRNAGRLISEMFASATVDQINDILGKPKEEILSLRAGLEGNDLVNQSEEVFMPIDNPVTGQIQGPSKVDRAQVNIGLGNEVTTQPQARQLAPNIVPVVDISRYLVHLMAEGATIGFNTTTTLAPSTTTTLIRIAGASIKDGYVYVKKVQLSVTPSAATVPTYQITGNSSPPASTVITRKMHFRALRLSGSLSIGDTILDKEYGEFTVPQGLDYVVKAENFVGGQIKISVGVEAFFIPRGVVGNRC